MGSASRPREGPGKEGIENTNARPLDPVSRQYLSAECEEIGFIYQSHTPHEANEINILEDVELTFIDNYHMPNSRSAIIYQVGKEKVLETTDKPLPSIEDANTKSLFVSDWTTESSGSIHHLVYIFNHPPSKRELFRSRSLDKSRAFINSHQDVQQEFTCRHCERKIHWTDLNTHKKKGDLTPWERLMHLGRQICGCKGIIANRNDFEEVEGILNIPPERVMAEMKGKE